VNKLISLAGFDLVTASESDLKMSRLVDTEERRKLQINYLISPPQISD